MISGLGTWAAFGVITVSALVALAILQGLTMAVGHRIGRYNVVDVLLSRSGGDGWGTVARRIILTQGAAQWFVSPPLQVSAVLGPAGRWGTVAMVAGAIVWVIGFGFEAVGDAQVRRFKADPAHRGAIMNRGLWAWTRHPNYFGDSAVWWGLWLICAAVWPGVLTVLSPVVMTYFLVYATGARLLEQSMSRRPGYRDYQQRTSYFLPRPPRRVATG